MKFELLYITEKLRFVLLLRVGMVCAVPKWYIAHGKSVLALVRQWV